MRRRTFRLNVRMTERDKERLDKLKAARQVYGVHTMTDVICWALEQVYDQKFPPIALPSAILVSKPVGPELEVNGKVHRKVKGGKTITPKQRKPRKKGKK